MQSTGATTGTTEPEETTVHGQREGRQKARIGSGGVFIQIEHEDPTQELPQ